MTTNPIQTLLHTDATHIWLDTYMPAHNLSATVVHATNSQRRELYYTVDSLRAELGDAVVDSMLTGYPEILAYVSDAILVTGDYEVAGEYELH